MNKNPGPDSAPRAELRKAVDKLRPYFVRAAALSVFASLLLLAPSAYMLEVYDRVVNSRSHTTLGMLTLLVIGTFIVMEILEWARTSILLEAGTALDNALRARVFNLTFEANLKKAKGGTAQTLTDLRVVRDFIASPAVTAMMEAPIALLFLVLIFAANPWLGWFATLGALVQTWIAFFNQKRSQPPLAAANMASISAQQYADSTLRNAQVIESMGMLKNIYRHWYERQHKIIFFQAQASDIAGTSNSLTRFWQLTIS
ncbi:MAG: type I secretion system permease/ATPase, partial [Rhodoferax sp.]|nr:type I secretion system permease/ATPase [Rhodoferax sp.]